MHYKSYFLEHQDIYLKKYKILQNICLMGNKI